MGKKDLTTRERHQIVQFLLEDSCNGKPQHGKIGAAAKKFQVSTRTVSRLWSLARLQKDQGQLINVESKKKHPRRQKTAHLNLEFIQNLPIHKRGTIRKLSMECKVGTGTVWRWVSKGLIKAHTSALKPDLTAPNKLLRIRFCLDAICYDRALNVMKFRSMQNIIHIDEKWFYITKKAHRLYVTPNEVEPHRTCKSKAFIPKVMFMCAVSRPVFANNGAVLFDGKIGIFPFTKKVAAKRDSINRLKGTLETKPIDSITKDVIRDCLVKEIIPAIKLKWPASASKTIFIQQDNAKPHLKDEDPEFRKVADSDGFNIHLIQQPPNSPDCNVNDLGFFRAIQSLQTEYSCSNAVELVKAVSTSFAQLTPKTLNSVFLSLQGCMVEIMKVRGQNTYKLPHMKKEMLIRQDKLPTNLEVSLDLVTDCILHLIEAGDTKGIELLMHRLGFIQ